MCPELFHPWNACQLVEEAGFLCKDLLANVLHGGDTPADVQTELFEFACRSKALESLPAHASQSHLSSDAHRETCFPAHLAAAKYRCRIIERRQEDNVFRAQKQGIVLRMGTGSANEAAEEEVLSKCSMFSHSAKVPSSTVATSGMADQ